MLSRATEDALCSAIAEAERRMIDHLSDGRDDEEPDVTGTLRAGIEIATESIEGVMIKIKLPTSMGPGAEESKVGADLEVVFLVKAEGLDLRKTFLVQSKMSGRELAMSEPSVPKGQFGHWTYDGKRKLDASGEVISGSITPRLASQCQKMLHLTSSAFVWVYSRHGVGVVSASAVLEARGRNPVRLGTKSLQDFFLHVSQSFFGDRTLAPSFDPDPMARQQMTIAVLGSDQLSQL